MSITSYILHCASDGTSPLLRPATHGAPICLAAYCPYLSGVSAGYSTEQDSAVLVLVNVLKVVQLQHNLLAYLL